MKKDFCFSTQFFKLIYPMLLVTVLSGAAFGATFTVTKTADTNDNVCDADCSLREAIAAATASAADDVIEFDAGIFNVPRIINLNNIGLDLSSSGGSLIINGPGARILTINSGTAERHFNLLGNAVVTINRLTLSGRYASGFGGGIDVFFATLTLNDSVLTNNAAQHGGGIRNGAGTVRINNSTITNNFSGDSGGGILNSGGLMEITNSTISNNLAANGGGGIFNSNGGNISLKNVTVSNNSISNGLGGGVSNNSGVDIIDVLNSIIADNTGSSAPDFSGNLTSKGYNLIENINGANITGITTGNILGQDPQLLPLRNYGGATQTYALQPTSPAIDAADPSNFTPTDQRGISRPQDGDMNGTALPDIGAYERQIIPFTVTKIDDTNDNVCDADCSLREALTVANTAIIPDSAIFFAPSVFNSPQTITLINGQLDITNNRTLLIYGPGAALLTISGNNLSRVIFIDTGAIVAINALTISGGNDPTSSGSCGGGGLLIHGALSLTNSIVTNNKSNVLGGGICTRFGSKVNINNSLFNHNTARVTGGGIFNNAGVINITNSIISNNTSNIDGGGIGNAGTMTVNNVQIVGNLASRGAGGFKNDGLAVVTDSVIDGNRANTGSGGGIGNSSNLTIANTTVNYNVAAREGGGISTGGTLNANSLSVSGNLSSFYGGGIYSGGAGNTVTIANSTISGNTASGSSMNDGNGGGIYNDSTFNLTNSTVSDNSVNITSTGESGLGGGIFNLRLMNLTNVTVSNNSAPRGGGGIRNGSKFSSSSIVNARNTIIADNNATISSPDFDGVLTSQGYNLIESITGTSITGTTTGNIIGQDPKLGLLASNGGLTQTRELLSGSPAIDAADPNNFPATDQRGSFRPKDGDRNGTILPDIGAFELGSAAKTFFDFDGDGKSDISVFRPSNGVWYLQQSTAGFNGVAFGASEDKPVPADYDGDGKADIAVFRPSNGVWYLQRSLQGFTGITFGASGDIPMPADYDGDGKADLAVFRPSNGVWYIQQSTTGFVGIAFGANGDIPVAADYDGDGKADVSVFRPANGTWYLQRSSLGFTGVVFGGNGDKPVPADYDGDGKADIAVFRPSNGVWYLQQSTAGFNGISFGGNGDLPVAADYDGDGKTDVSVFRPSNGTWYLNRSTQGFTGVLFGATGDKPAPNAFIQ